MAWDRHPSKRRATLPADWAAVRRRVLHRDGHRCQIRGSRCIGRATEVDHVGDPLDHSDANLRSACTPCHAPRSSRQGGLASGSARRSRAASRTRPPEPHPSERAQK